MKKHVMTLLLAVGLAGGLAAIPASAQQNGGGGAGGGAGGAGGGGGGGRGGRGGGGAIDPAQLAQFRQAMQDRMKTAMGATDDEWKVLQPKIDKVQTAQGATRGAGGFGGLGGGRGGRRGGNNADGTPADNTPPAPPADANAVTKANYDLQVVLTKKDATADEIKAKLDALRAAKKTAKDELTKAQDDLKSVCSARQEAVLVEDGLLE